MDINFGEVWFAKFPYDEDENQIRLRSVIILDVDVHEVLVVKVAKLDSRKYVDFDLPILYWREAKLEIESITRISQTLYLPRKAFDFKIGDIDEYDLKAIQEPFKKFISLSLRRTLGRLLIYFNPLIMQARK